MKGKKTDFGKNTWSLHQHCVPAYIIITSVKPHQPFNRDPDSASSGTIQLEQAKAVQTTPLPFPNTLAHARTHAHAEQKGTETLWACSRTLATWWNLLVGCLKVRTWVPASRLASHGLLSLALSCSLAHPHRSPPTRPVTVRT